ncbi:MAG TPA: septum formation family protein [Acidimicrobiales bacterium]|jgi:hypothetical protein|nr:septum formation family protein [Acidimicrobiales bacterium]
MIAALPFACSHTVASVGSNQSVFKLKVGDCLVPPTAIKAEINSIKVVRCAQPHTQEVFAKVQYGPLGTATTSASTAYPGVTPLETFANGACLQRFAGYVGVDYRYSSLYYTYMLPSPRSWSSSMNDRTIWCLITTTGQQLTGSVKGSRR